MKLYVLSSMIIIAGAFSFSMSSCSSNADAKPTAVNEKDDASGYGPEWKPSDEWKAYWYKGLAEVSSYEIMQGRYYESHPGNAVNIFVTEDLSKERHVKLDIPSAAGNDVCFHAYRPEKLSPCCKSDQLYSGLVWNGFPAGEFIR
jgi:maltose-binding protein MalE